MQSHREDPAFPHQGHGRSIHRGVPDLHSIPEVLLPPGPEILLTASPVYELYFPASYMLSSIPDIPDEPTTLLGLL